MSKVLRFVFTLVLTASSLSAATTLPANVEKLDSAGGLTQYRLKSNGMTLLLKPDRAAPVITFMVVYHVGSRNESPGNTGSAHLLEHMIFNKSTQNFGKANGHKTFQEVLYEAGADFSSTNMTTWNDRMNGYSTLPKDKLELAMKIEADRLARGLILDEERKSEMSVVRNEYEIDENNPGSALEKAVVGTAILAHPYHWSTIGYRSDIEGVTTEQLREHYKNFFHPDNSEAILVGDFDEAQALAMFDREFGQFPRSPKPIPQVITEEPPQEGERRVIVKRPGKLSLVQIAYMRPGSLHPDFIPLDVLTAILSDGVTSRLYQAAVEKGLATDIYAINYTLRDPYLIHVGATVSSESNPAKVEEALKNALYAIAREGVTEEELARAKEQIEVGVIRSRDGTYNFTSSLGEAVASANWKWFVSYSDNVRKVTRADIKRVASTYLVPDHATVGWFVPADEKSGPVTAAAVDEKPVAAKVTPKVAPMAAPSAAAKRPAQGTFASRTTRKVLPNGLIVDVIENHAVPTVAVRGLIFAGSSASAAQPAVPELTAMMVQRGTKKRSKQQIASQLESAGITMFIGSNTFETNINAGGLSRDLPTILEVLADELLNPTFPADEFEKARAEMKNNIIRNAENTSTRAIERLTQVVYPEKHPYRAPGKDALTASVEKVSQDDLRAFHAKRYVGGSTILAIVGAVDTAKTIAMVEKLFGAMPKGERPAFTVPVTTPVDQAVREAVTMRGKANMNIVIGHASGLRRLDPDYEAALVANAVLGQTSLSSRIGKRVRDTEGLSYNLSSRFNMTDMLDGVWLANVNVAPSNLAAAMKSTLEEVHKFYNEGVTPEEVEAQKSFFAGNYQVGLASNGGVANSLITAEKFGYGPSYLDQFPQRIKRVTMDEVNAAIKKHFHPSKMHVVVAGDLDVIP